MIRNKRRHNTGFGYIGSGNKISVFNRKPRKAFSEIKGKLNFESQKEFEVKFNNKILSDPERKTIKTKVQKGEKEKLITVLIISFLLLILLFFALKYILDISTHNS